MASTVLVVEDEAKIRELLRSYLERSGYEVVSTGSGAEALTLVDAVSPELIVLDLRLPDVSGEEVASEVRRSRLTPILMLTAKSSSEHRIRGFELGADDYVVKPFSPQELVLRVRAILRRGVEGSVPGDGPRSFGGGELVVDDERHLVWVRGELVELTPTERGLLGVLASVPGRVRSRYELINRLRGYEYEGYERTVDSHVKNLRRKIERDPHDPRIVVTVLGAGYRFGLDRDE
jgi:DNA-binding response OmpR family regulator